MPDRAAHSRTRFGCRVSGIGFRDSLSAWYPFRNSAKSVTAYFKQNVIEAGPEMVLENGANVDLRATKLIRLNPGFRAKRGSYFHASIT